MKPESEAVRVLEEFAIKKAPVDVEMIARGLGAELSFEPFKAADDVSGLLFREADRVIIGVNAAHSETRQRFTIAHEIGHFLLHPGRPLILDKSLRVNRRDSVSAMAIDREEIDANQFAAHLLMPREFVEDHLDRLLNRRQAVTEAKLIAELASLFDVSTQAMEFRLVNLSILPSR